MFGATQMPFHGKKIILCLNSVFQLAVWKGKKIHTIESSILKMFFYSFNANLRHIFTQTYPYDTITHLN